MYVLFLEKQKYCESAQELYQVGSLHMYPPHTRGLFLTKKLVEVCGILEKLECGDKIMADKGFQIQDLLAPLGV